MSASSLSNLFITGTDTGVGKTRISAMLVRALRSAGVDAVGMKPICAGDRDDARQLHAASDCIEPLNVLNPIWYRTPAAPYTAAMVEERPVDLTLIREQFAELRQRHPGLIVEGVGGWLVPVTRDFSMADLAAEMALPIAVVVRNRLGAINHTLLTLSDIERRGLPLAGWIFNDADEGSDVADATNCEILTDVIGKPPLWRVERHQRSLVLP